MDQVRLLLTAAQSRGIRGSIGLAADEDDDPDYVPYEENDIYFPWTRQRPQESSWFKPVTEPQTAGVELMNGGEFGRLGAKKTINARRRLKEREMGRMGRKSIFKGMMKEDFSRVRQSIVCRRLSY